MLRGWLSQVLRRGRAASAVASGPRAMAAADAAHDGASLSDRSMWSWRPPAGSADADLLPELPVLWPRARDLARNNGIAAGALQTLVDNVVGATLRLSATPDYRLLGWDREQARAWGNRVEALFRTWADTPACDATGGSNLLGLTLLMLRGALLNGDALALVLWVQRPGERWATRLQVVEADRLETPPWLTGRADVRRGVEVDAFGAPVAYWVRRRHPGEDWRLGAMPREDAFERVPAVTPWGRRRVIHLFDRERAGQSRGKPLVTAVMREFHLAGRYETAELQAAVANAMVAAFLEADLGPEATAQLFGDDPRGSWHRSVEQARNVRLMEGGTVIPLPAGARVASFVPGRPNAAFDQFMQSTLRHIAAGLNLPYELLLKDFSRTNYSSARAALLEAWRYFQGRRRWLTDQWLRPVYELWLEEAVNAGAVEAPEFYARRAEYGRCRFIFSGRGWVDPVKEAQAALLRVQAGLSTMEMECAEQGLDWEEVLEQQAHEAQRRQALGLGQPPAATGQEPEPEEEEAPAAGDVGDALARAGG